MAHVEIYPRPATRGTAGLPRKDDAVVAGDGLPGASIINLGDLPAETRANCQEREAQDYGLLVAGQRREESFHIW